MAELADLSQSLLLISLINPLHHCFYNYESEQVFPAIMRVNS